jgi:hypothetical protein
LPTKQNVFHAVITEATVAHKGTGFIVMTGFENIYLLLKRFIKAKRYLDNFE